MKWIYSERNMYPSMLHEDIFVEDNGDMYSDQIGSIQLIVQHISDPCIFIANYRNQNIFQRVINTTTQYEECYKIAKQMIEDKEK